MAVWLKACADSDSTTSVWVCLWHVGGKPPAHPPLFLLLTLQAFCHILSDTWSRRDSSRHRVGNIPPECGERGLSAGMRSSVREPGWSLSPLSGSVVQRSGPGRRASDLWWVSKCIQHAVRCFKILFYSLLNVLTSNQRWIFVLCVGIFQEKQLIIVLDTVLIQAPVLTN